MLWENIKILNVLGQNETIRNYNCLCKESNSEYLII